MADYNSGKGQPGPAIQQAYRYLANGEHEPAEQLCRQLMQQYPGIADVQHLQAVVYEQTGQPRRGMQAVQRALKQQPENPLFNLTLAKLQYGLGRRDTAEQTLLRVLAIRPDLVAAHFQLGVWCSEQRRYREAEKHYRDALACQADDARLYNNLGTVLRELGREGEARDCYRRALALQPAYLTALMNLASTQMNLGDYNDATALFTRVLQLRPGLAEPHIYLGEMQRFQGRLQEAADEYRQAIAVRADFTEAYRLLTIVDNELRPEDIAAMEALDAGSLDDGQRMHLQFALARVYEDAGETDRAFTALQQGNRLYRSRLDYDVRNDVAAMQQLEALFDADFVAGQVAGPISEEMPVFIIGMPRSGTTLAESILSSHPQVFGAGEVGVLAKLVAARDGSFPGAVTGMDRQALDALARAYMERLADLNRDNRRLVVNKMPNNFLYLGLIYMLFPRARVIHCVRDPVATCLSCFKQYFVGPQPFAYDLDDLCRYYAAYHRLMAHWQAVLPGYIHELRYEDLIQEPEEQIRQLLAYCGLDWDDRCLEFHRQERRVRTASSAQVRQPLYQTSARAWEKYHEQLRPLIQCLQQHGVSG